MLELLSRGWQVRSTHNATSSTLRSLQGSRTYYEPVQQPEAVPVNQNGPDPPFFSAPETLPMDPGASALFADVDG